MRKNNISAQKIAREYSLFTAKSAQQALSDNLSIEDIGIMSRYMSNSQTLVYDLDDCYKVSVEDLNQQFVDFRNYLLYQRLDALKHEDFNDNSSAKNAAIDIINRSPCDNVFKKLMTDRIRKSKDTEQLDELLPHLEERLNKAGAYMIIQLCKNADIPLSNERIRFLLNTIPNHYSINICKMLANEIISGKGIRDSLAAFDALSENQNMNEVANLCIENNLSMYEASMLSLDRALTSAIPATEQPKPSWVRIKKASLQSQPVEDRTISQPPNNTKVTENELPYLHENIDPSHLIKGKLITRKIIGNPINVGNDQYVIYANGLLGEGGFGRVVLAQNVKTQEWIALKSFLHPTRDQDIADQEVENLKLTDQFVFTASQDNQLYIGMKLSRGQELFEVLNNQTQLAPAQRLLIAKLVLKGMLNLHVDKKTIINTTVMTTHGKVTFSRAQRDNRDTVRKQVQKRILHRDIKPENILLDGALIPRHIDMGLAGVIPKGENRMLDRALLGTPLFVPPELKLSAVKIYGADSEVYSLGVTLMEIAGPDTKNSKALTSLVKLAKMMTDKDSSNRPSIVEAYAKINTIISQSNATHNSPEGLKPYAISMQDYKHAAQSNNLDELIQECKDKGVNTVAFYSTKGQVDDTLLIDAQRQFQQAGILHKAPKIYYGPDQKTVIASIEKYYNEKFLSATTNIDYNDERKAESKTFRHT